MTQSKSRGSLVDRRRFLREGDKRGYFKATVTPGQMQLDLRLVTSVEDPNGVLHGAIVCCRERTPRCAVVLISERSGCGQNSEGAPAGVKRATVQAITRRVAGRLCAAGQGLWWKR
jgi:hypothetical protein